MNVSNLTVSSFDTQIDLPMIMRIRSKNPKIPITIMSQFSRTGLQGSLESPKSPPVVHHVPESQEQTCSALSDCEQRPFIPHASSTFPAY